MLVATVHYGSNQFSVNDTNISQAELLRRQKHISLVELNLRGGVTTTVLFAK